MKKESGRSLVEMLGVLAVVAVILLASLFMFNSLFKQYQKRETVSEMHTLVTRFKTSSLSKMATGEVKMKKLMPEATVEGNKIKTADGGNLFLVANPEGSTFVVIANNLGLSCDDFVSEGNYDAVTYGDSETVPETLTNLYSRDKAVEALRTICDGKYQYFLYGNASEGCKNFINGKCSNCPEAGQVVGRDGLCCSPAELAAKCGYCGTPCGGNGKCVDGVCSECKTDPDCKNNPDNAADKKFYCVESVCKQCREIGKECNKTDWPGDYICNSNRRCVQCDTTFEFWNGFNCECKLDKPDLGEACSEKCGCVDDSLTCTNGFCLPNGEGSEDCLNDATAKAQNRLCKDTATGACVCCEDAKQDKNGNCVDCSKNADGRTRFDNTKKECVCQPGYEYNAILGRCEPDSNCEEKCLGKPPVLKGESCAGENACCCDRGLECKNNTCQCPTIPKVENATCNAACGCKADTELQCSSTTHKCQCPSDKPIWDADQGKCVQCLTTDDCEGNTWCDTTVKECKPCSTTPVPTCSISEDVKDAKGCVLKTPFTCPGEKDNAKNLICKNNTTCVECTNNLHCPENTFCNLDTNTCLPCGPSNPADPFIESIRPKGDAGRCGCPEGYRIYCGSTTAGYGTACQEGNYICAKGCQQTSDCPMNQFCYKNPATAFLGECKPCDEGKYRGPDELDCHACEGCEVFDETAGRCVSSCKNDEVCLMKSCTATSKNGACEITPKGTWSCLKKPKLTKIKGKTVGGWFYLPPAESQYLMNQSDAARFCEKYGYHLSSIQEACGKDWAYDSGHDCKNISEHNLSQYGNRGGGTFWMDARYGATCTALTITYSCGNNHEHSICGEVMYPICTDGSVVKCDNSKECPENYYCTKEGCQPCSSDGSAIRKSNDKSCRCHSNETQYCGGPGNWKTTNCKEGAFICKSECYFNTQCGKNKYCAKEEDKEFGQCSSCPEGQIRDEKDEACHGCKESKDCPTNSECKIEDGAETGTCTPCQEGYKREWYDNECKKDRWSDFWSKFID